MVSCDELNTRKDVKALVPWLLYRKQCSQQRMSSRSPYREQCNLQRKAARLHTLLFASILDSDKPMVPDLLGLFLISRYQWFVLNNCTAEDVSQEHPVFQTLQGQCYIRSWVWDGHHFTGLRAFIICFPRFWRSCALRESDFAHGLGLSFHLTSISSPTVLVGTPINPVEIEDKQWSLSDSDEQRKSTKRVVEDSGCAFTTFSIID